MYGSIPNDGLPDLDPGYSQEGDEGPLFPPNTLGRDERADELDRSKRSLLSKGLPHVGSPGKKLQVFLKDITSLPALLI